MRLDRAKELAKQYGKRLVASSGYSVDLFEGNEYIDTLHEIQISELEEEDYINFYLLD